jgi:2-methylcitrate dehydratase PrpD
VSDSPDELVIEKLVGFVSELTAQDLPETVRHECRRSLLDSVGCIVGGSNHTVVARATQTLSPFFGAAQATLLGQGRQADVFHAALINGLAGAAYSFFDSYSTAHLHAGVAHASTLLALSERSRTTGVDFVSAFAAGVEVACRLTNALALSPAKADPGWSVGGIVCAVSSAVAGAKLLGLDRNQLTWAIGIGAAGAAGTRAEFGTMTASLLFGQAAQTGVRAAILAAGGFTSSPRSIDGQYGYARMFSRSPNLQALTDGLGEHYELAGTTYKPYPTDIAIHPGIDAMLALKNEHGFDSRQITRVQMRTSNLAVAICNRPHAANELEAKFSLQHWVAACAVHGKARLDQGRQDVIDDPEVRRLCAVMELTPVPELAWHAIEISLELSDGRRLSKRIAHCFGTRERPMSDSLLEEKFLAQAERAIGRARAVELAQLCWGVEGLPDMTLLTQKAG